MSKFHSTVSRRAFMKGLGLTGAGLGAAAATTPVYHDLDEVLSQPVAAEPKRPWYVKEVDEPMVEIDWNKLHFDGRGWRNAEFVQHENESIALMYQMYGSRPDETESKEPWTREGLGRGKPLALELRRRWAREDAPAMGHKYQALANAMSVAWRSKKTYDPAPTPEEIGVSKWQGTPEENMRLMRVASRFFGAHDIGAFELDEKGRKVINAISRSGRARAFEDVDKPYRTDTKEVIPNSYRWVIPHTLRQADAIFTATGALGTSSTARSYFQGSWMDICIGEFLRGLGYSWVSVQAGSAASATMSGLSEIGRHNQMITTSHGTIYRLCNKHATDLPMPTTKPIDFGVRKFCETCKKCADRCPTATIPLDTEPTWDSNSYTTVGIRTWSMAWGRCGIFKSPNAPGYCGLCMVACPFSKKKAAGIHDVVTAISSITPIFNGFFTTMDTTFGYAKNLGGDRAHENDNYHEEWWDTLGPEYGFHTYYGNSPPSGFGKS